MCTDWWWEALNAAVCDSEIDNQSWHQPQMVNTSNGWSRTSIGETSLNALLFFWPYVGLQVTKLLKIIMCCKDKFLPVMYQGLGHLTCSPSGVLLCEAKSEDLMPVNNSCTLL